jgi:hypothetical protein
MTYPILSNITVRDIRASQHQRLLSILILSSIGGWVLNNDVSHDWTCLFLKGFTINKCAVDGLAVLRT